jgi:hypothetical protein
VTRNCLSAGRYDFRLLGSPASLRTHDSPTNQIRQSGHQRTITEGRGRARKEASSVPGPGRTLGDEVVASEDELGDGEDALLEERRDGARARDPLHRALVELVQLLLRLHGGPSVASLPPETKGKADG